MSYIPQQTCSALDSHTRTLSTTYILQRFTKQASKGKAYLMLIAYTFVLISNKLNTRPSLKVNLQNKELV